ncbi:MAG: hypothetical protein IJC92_04480 [Bacteroidaceae bacterium]|nr:hypothetical protein [Bacteroidaceae bacterium]
MKRVETMKDPVSLFTDKRDIVRSARVAYIAILSISLCLLAQPANAQIDAWKDIVEENIKINTQIKQAVADTISLCKEIETKKENNARLQARLDSIRNEIKSCKDYISRDRKNSLKRSNDSLRMVIDQLNNEKSVTDSVAQDKKKELAAMHKALGDMDEYADIQKEMEYEQEMAIIERKYSQIKDVQLKELRKKTQKYRRKSFYTENLARIDAAERNRELFLRAKKALNTPYNRGVVEGLREEIGVLLQTENDDAGKGIFKLSEKQFPEMDTLDIKLSRFEWGTIELKDLVSKVNDNEDIKRHREAGDKVQCLRAMRAILYPSDEESAETLKSYIMIIPYLNELLGNYREELQKNPIEYPTPTEKIILNLAE